MSGVVDYATFQHFQKLCLGSAGSILLLIMVIISSAQLVDCQDIFDLVNEAYEVEIGNDGLAFKNCARFSALSEVKECLDNMWIIRDEDGTLVGTVRAVAKEEGVIHVGPLAVRKSHQVKWQHYLYEIYHDHGKISFLT